MTTLLYFARVRQQVGLGHEEVELPSDVLTVADVIEWLKTRDEAYMVAFHDLRGIRAAVDQAHAGLDAIVTGAKEIAFFPPVTGG
jgi:molybdopterin synthase sulfur carrier subunit